MRIEIVADVKTTLGEGPLWDVEQQRLYWVDSFDGRVFRSTEDGRELRAWDVGQKIGSMTLRKQGDHALVALQNGLHDLDMLTGDLSLIIDPEPHLPHNRLNDGKVDRQGVSCSARWTLEKNWRQASYIGSIPIFQSTSSTKESSAPTAHAGVRMETCCISQTPGPASNGSTTTI